MPKNRSSNCVFNFSLQEHACRSEGVEMARDLDYKSAAAWIGHPYFDVIDNSTDFETKINRMLECVCQKLGIDTGDRLLRTSRKLKFLGKFFFSFLFNIHSCHTMAYCYLAFLDACQMYSMLNNKKQYSRALKFLATIVFGEHCQYRN